jgi:DNA (cytosine-5)-methyltransferase 1
MNKPVSYGSVCSGIEAASVAWHCLGWQPAWFAEIEKFPSAVLACRWPDVSNLGDMMQIAAAIRAGKIEAPDVLVGGTPCQAFSVAGLRNGLADERGQLTLAFVELVNAIDEKRREQGKSPAIVVWENVPGVFSSKDNAFGCFLAGLAGESSALESPGKRWSNAGYVLGPERAIAWRVLDAQFFGVAQRRRRVFVVATARGDIDPAKILFESEGLRRNSPPCRKKEKAVAALTSNGVGVRGADDNQAQAGHLIPECVTGDISHTLKAEGFDGSEDGTGRGTPIIAMAHGQGGAEIKTDDTAPTLTCNHEAPIVFSSNGHASFAPGVGALRAKSGADHETLAIHGTQDPDTLKDLAHTLGRNHGQENAVVYAFKAGQGAKAGGIGWAEEQSPTLTAASSGSNLSPSVMKNMAVRRLTPVECERLQGFPDNHTLIPTEKRKQITADEYAYLRHHRPELTAEQAFRLAADGPRYKAIGNSMAVPVMRWIGSRIQEALRA